MSRSSSVVFLLVALVLFFIGCSDPVSDADRSDSSVPSGSDTEEPMSPSDSDGDAEMSSEEMPADGEDAFVEIAMPIGSMVLRLYGDTPQHQKNFLKLIQDGYYEGTAFHRVMEGFMIQGGDPNSKDDNRLDDGLGGPGYEIENEAMRKYYHKRGAVAGAQKPNDELKSSGSQFYIVHGGNAVPDDMVLNDMQNQIRGSINDPNFTFSTEARNDYKKTGGAPWLDMQYTVFGELVEGFDVLDKIATLPTPRKTNSVRDPRTADSPPDLNQVRITNARILTNYVASN